MKITIKHRVTDAILFEGDYETTQNTVLEALRTGTNLSGANLRGANLRGTDLREAELRGANLCGAELQNAKFYGRGGTSKLKKNQVTDFLNALGFQVE